MGLTQLACCVLMLVSSANASLKAAEALRLASPFTDHAVMQRDMPVPVWGRAHPAAEVVVRFAGQEKSAMADKDGKWMLKLDRLAASMDGQELIVTSGTETARIKDVLVGEVWLSMGFVTGLSAGDELPLNASLRNDVANDISIRFFEPKFVAADEPQEMCQGQWSIAQRRHALSHFAQELRTKLNVPIGVIDLSATARGNSGASWISRSALESSPFGRADLYSHQKAVARFEFVVNDWETNDGKAMKAEAKDYSNILRKAGKKGFVPVESKPDAKNHPDLLPSRPAAAFNGTVRPLIPFAIRGLVCTGSDDWWKHSCDRLIDAWRNEWKQLRLPAVRSRAGWSEFEIELRNDIVTVGLAGTHATGLDDFDETHAKRLSLAALAKVYVVDVEWAVPRCDHITAEGKKVTLHFAACKTGILKESEDIEGFEVQSTDGVWKRANAELNGDTVVVSSDDVAKPVRVRFGPVRRKDRNEEHELWNKAGFAVEPFEIAVGPKP